MTDRQQKHEALERNRHRVWNEKEICGRLFMCMSKRDYILIKAIW